MQLEKTDGTPKEGWMTCGHCGVQKHVDHFLYSTLKRGCDECARKVGKHLEQIEEAKENKEAAEWEEAKHSERFK